MYTFRPISRSINVQYISSNYLGALILPCSNNFTQVKTMVEIISLNTRFDRTFDTSCTISFDTSFYKQILVEVFDRSLIQI